MSYPFFSIVKSKPGLVVIGCSLSMAGFFVGRFTAPKSSPPEINRGNSHTIVAANESPAPSSFPPAIPPAHTTTSAPSTPDDARWEDLISQAATPARNNSLATLLEQMAARDPARAIALAQAEPNRQLRDKLIEAALRGWATVAPEAASQWAINLPYQKRLQGMAAVFHSAAKNPQEAVRIANQVCQADPTAALDHGLALINALSDTGDFAIAAKFAATASPDQRASWLQFAFNNWALHQPEIAVNAARTLSNDPDVQRDAFQGVIGGWAQSDPAALAEYSQQMPPGPERTRALEDSLRQWVDMDAAAATAWIDKFDPSPELDAGTAAVASLPRLVNSHPDIAVSWAESISNETLRSETLANIIREWAAKDRAAAKKYAESAKDILPGDKNNLTEFFQQTPP